MSITKKLDRLLVAYEAKGYPLSKTLQNGLSESEIVETCSWFPGKLPKELIEMYQWRNGPIDDPEYPEQSFWFRDMEFSSIQLAEMHYDHIMSSYGPDATLEDDGIDLSMAFPFAAFEGGWYVLPCSEQTMAPKHVRPVVSVFEGIDVYFYSMETMLDTCIEWIQHPDYQVFGHLG
jgi:hypothetical protein